MDTKLQSIPNLTGKISIPERVHYIDYNDLRNLPSIESVQLSGNKTLEDLGMVPITGEDLVKMFEEIWR